MEENVFTEARSALARHHLECRHIELLSPRAAGKGSGRLTLRAELTNGSTIKIRCLESVEAASRLADLRSRTNSSFAPIVAREGAVLIESWIDGEELSPEQAAARAHELGAILGGLHATTLPAGRHTVSTHERLERATGQLEQLADSGVLSSESSEVLQGDLRRTDPGESLQTLVHLDYCPENLVVDSIGSLHVVDNEWIGIDAPGVDLGRTCARWWANDEVWARFMTGYRTRAPFDPGPLRFWMIAMAASGAVFRLENKSAEELAVPLARLRDLAAAGSRE
jgi:Ser/Thr protein kinase RdoA (MazF antagonist)